MLAIAGGKGGCGKTTVTLGLAAAYGRQRRRPLAVDADVDASNLHVLAGTPADPLDGDDDPASRAHPADDYPGVWVLPTCDRENTVLEALLEAPPPRRPVVVDCPAGASRAVAAPLRRADAALVVTTSEPQTVEDALKTAAMSRTLGTPVAGVVCNRAKRAPSSLADAFGAPCLACLPRVDSASPADACRASFDRLASVLGPNP